MKGKKKAPGPSPSPSPTRSAVPWALLAVAAAILFVAVVRLRVADVPLERDEGEYAYAGRLILEGVPPYSVAYNMKFPGTYYAYALMLLLFGKTAWGVHAGLLAANIATIVLVFLLGRRLAGDLAGSTAAVAYALLSMDPWVHGLFAHATHFVVLAVMAGLLVLLRAIEDGRAWRFVVAGAWFGAAVLMKQHAVFLVLVPLVLLAWPKLELRRLGLFAAGSAAPVVLIFGLLAVQGVFPKFWFWTFRYAAAYVSEVPASAALSSLASGFGFASTSSLAFWIAAGAGLVMLFIKPWDRRVRLVLAGLLLASFVSIFPGFYFRSHYFILMLPAVALLTGVAVASARQKVGLAALALLVIPAGVLLTKAGSMLFTMTPRELSRAAYGFNPFVEAPEIGKYLKEHTAPDERIAVVGSEPEIYFYADRKGATGYIYTYALMEPQPYAKRMQEEMIAEIEAAHPRYLVFAWIEDSWLAQPGSDQGIIIWCRRYVRECYEPVGVADIVSEEETRFAWDADARGYQAASPNLVYTFKRKGDAPCTVPR